MLLPETDQNRRPQAVAVIDFYTHERGGHFGDMLKWYAREFIRRVDRVLIYTPDPTVTQELFTESDQRLSFHSIPEKTETIHDLLAGIAGQHAEHRVGAFFMWACDIFGLAKYTNLRTAIPWSLFGTFSWATRDPEAPMSRDEALTLRYFLAHPDCVAIAQPDPFIQLSESKFVTIIDRFDPLLPSSPSALGTAIREFAEGHLVIGNVGHLFGFRGVHEILNLALEQPNLRFVLAGRLFEETVHPTYLAALQSRRIPNVLFLPGYIEGGAAFDDCLAALDAILVDGRGYPNQSGVGCKALALGKYLLSPLSNSWMCDVIQRYRVGHSYAGAQDDLLRPWTEWMESEGPLRARQAVLEICHPEQNQRSLDTLCSRLFAHQPATPANA